MLGYNVIFFQKKKNYVGIKLKRRLVLHFIFLAYLYVLILLG